MSSKVLSGRRKVFPQKSLPVIVPGYQLTFDMAGLPYLEPGFGVISKITSSREADETTGLSKTRPFADCQVGGPLHCVAHLITPEEMQRIIETEGGNGNPDVGYQTVEIRCQTYDGDLITGVTLIDPRLKEQCLHPSERYHRILLDGAVENGLQPEYIERLKQVVPYRPQTVGQTVGKCLFLAIAVPLMLPYICFMIGAMVLKLPVPRLVSSWMDYMKRVVWALHDYVLAPVFGKGC
ncbi:hypothetical protein DL89DRAFT_269041 [Linderina pennispora]|uniref:gamma-glutamylcyclotransferase n=1 Tax=Linderina pennispora TaxID=61395 RepID=A0A1Y1W2T0_9FUNG|nr:uncharacterized protein DL89DRAFT_269041 [Linderina pennispora]ORX67860.1 hypothetical protein DL89DRAFT_269041 [Linderina pennispora]